MNITATNYWQEETFISARQWAEREYVRRTKIRRLGQLKHICADLGRKMGFEPEIDGRSPYWIFLRPLAWDENGEPAIPRQKEIDGAAEEIARLSGWVNLAVTLPLPGGNTVATPWLLVNERPAGSDYQTLPPYYKSPYRIQKTAWAAYRRALPIARAYGIGKKRLVMGLMEALSVHIGRPHKLAIRAVACALPRWIGNAYYKHDHRSAIRALQAARGLKRYYALDPETREYVRAWFHAHDLPCVADAIDMALNATREEAGPWWLIAQQPALVRMGVAAYPALTSQLRVSWVVQADGREDYHTETWYGPHDAIRQAVSAWRRQAAERKLEARQFARIALDGSIRATIQHSLAAGNCRPGTEAWMRQHGIQDGVEARHLLRYRHDHRVRRVLAQVAA